MALRPRRTTHRRSGGKRGEGWPGRFSRALRSHPTGVLCALLTLSAPAAFADPRPFLKQALLGYGAYDSAVGDEKHPKRGSVGLFMNGDSFASLDPHFLCFRYTTTDPSKGKVLAKVTRVRSGKSKRIAKLKSKIRESGSNGDCKKGKKSLEEGDILIFDFKFKKMPKIPFNDGVAALAYLASSKVVP